MVSTNKSRKSRDREREWEKESTRGKKTSQVTRYANDICLLQKENPRIKRNAMHAYITYMIYTNMSHENSVSVFDEYGKCCPCPPYTKLRVSL